MRTDYFSRAAFRSFIGDDDKSLYQDEAIDLAQSEVIERLEAWSSSAWPTVDPDAETTDGVTTAPRSAIEHPDGGNDVVFLEHLPVIAVESITLVGNALSPVAYTAHLAEGVVTFAAVLPVWAGVRVSYSYGFTETPATIRRAAMLATKTLLESAPGRSKIPPKTRSVTSEGTTIELSTEDGVVDPWPWDLAASALVVTYWDRERPRKVGAA